MKLSILLVFTDAELSTVTSLLLFGALIFFLVDFPLLWKSVARIYYKKKKKKKQKNITYCIQYHLIKKMRIVIRNSAQNVAEYAAELSIERINAMNPSAGRPFILGLPTGGTPVKTYQALIAAYRHRRVSFKNVVTFNMDEYVGLPREHPESYWAFMHQHFFNWVDIPSQNINILDGNAADLVAECNRFEEKIKSSGGIDLFLGGVGSDGHIAFNEPGSAFHSRTRVKSLNDQTSQDNSRFFGGELTNVPTMALTVGVQTIMDARGVVVIATGARKAVAVARCVEGAISNACPISVLQLHPAAVIVIDDEATAELKVKTVKYFQALAKRENELALRQSQTTPSAKL